MTYALLAVGIAVVVGMTVYMVTFLSGFAVMPWGAPYVPCNDANRARARKLLRGKKLVLDLGSGDGRLMVDLAEGNGTVHGYELNPILVWRSRRTLRKAGLSGRTRVFLRNFWRHDLGEYDTVCVYGISYMMERLERKLLSELRPGATVVSVGFRFPNWKPAREDGPVRLYEKPV